MTILERDVRLSESLLWRRQRDYYAERGSGVWREDAVPQYATNNPFLAEVYARLAREFMQECGGGLRVLELGAGTGKFAFLFLRQLEALLGADALAQDVGYCATESADAVVSAWQSNARLAPLFERGVLTAERWRAGEEAQLHSLTDEPETPLVVIASYVFDSLPQDSFRVRDGKLFELLLCTTALQGDAPVSQLQLSFRETPAELPRYAEFRPILESYACSLTAAEFTLPTQALRTLAAIRAARMAPVLVLVADKGFVCEPELAWGRATEIQFHGQHCFSQLVNLDAIAKYSRAVGGEAVVPNGFGALRLCAFMLRQKNERSLPARTLQACREAQQVFGPGDVFTLLGWMHPQMETASLAQVLAVLRLTRWDPVALLRLYPAIARALPGVTTEREELRDAVLRTWANHFPVMAEEDMLAFQCGAILLSLGFHAEAEPMFLASQRAIGRTAATSYNLGRCAQGLGRSNEALQYMDEACALDAAFAAARDARDELSHKSSR